MKFTVASVTLALLAVTGAMAQAPSSSSSSAMSTAASSSSSSAAASSTAAPSSSAGGEDSDSGSQAAQSVCSALPGYDEGKPLVSCTGTS